MAQPHEKIARALERLRELQEDGRRIFRSDAFTRTDRERLDQAGFLRQIIQGWWMSTTPQAEPGDTTAWYACFWEFCARYCRMRFGDRWHLSPQQSLRLTAEDTAIPRQVVIYAPEGHNNEIDLPHDTSIFVLRYRQNFSPTDVVERDDLRLLEPQAALIKVSPDFYEQHPTEAQIVLSRTDVSGMLSRLLDGGHSVVAGRLAGALRRVDRPDQADEILDTMRDAGYDVRENDPFESGISTVQTGRAPAPIAARVRMLWTSTRDAVRGAFPPPPGLPTDPDPYMDRVEGLYVHDAYHSLSIEGCRVTPELVGRVRTGAWNPAENRTDREQRDALAARGYWEAFQEVKATLQEILDGQPPGTLARADHQRWYRKLFAPSVRAGLIALSTLAGYRGNPVFLRNSRHVPPRAAVVSDAMSVFFDCLEEESEPAVRAVLGHWLFGYIHPYPDGNGRMARFLMNAMFASGGYPWTIIRVEERDAYLEALEAASVDQDLSPLADFLARRRLWSLGKVR